MLMLRGVHLDSLTVAASVLTTKMVSFLGAEQFIILIKVILFLRRCRSVQEGHFTLSIAMALYLVETMKLESKALLPLKFCNRSTSPFTVLLWRAT